MYSIILYPFINGLTSTKASKQQVSPPTSHAIEPIVIRRVYQRRVLYILLGYTLFLFGLFVKLCGNNLKCIGNAREYTRID